MSVSVNRIHHYLLQFGLDEEEAMVYLHLFKQGMLSVLDISRDLKMSRPKLYRVLDRLEKMDLVVRDMAKGSRFAAASYRHLEIMLTKKEQELARLAQVKQSLFEDLEQLSRRFGDTSFLKTYMGMDGLQEVYKLTFGQDEVVLLDSGELKIHKDEEFWKMLQKGWLKKRTRVTLLSNLKQREKEWFSPTFLKDCWSAWWIDPAEFLVPSDTIVFADTVVVCEEQRSGVMCYEFRNRLLAQMVKRMFDFVWVKGEEQPF